MCDAFLGHSSYGSKRAVRGTVEGGGGVSSGESMERAGKSFLPLLEMKGYYNNDVRTLKSIRERGVKKDQVAHHV